MSTCVEAGLKSKVALFNNLSDNHTKKQAVNPFSNGNTVASLGKPKISKEDYGKPPKGSLSEQRGFKATISVCREMLQLCEVINQFGEPLFAAHEKKNDPRKVISFGNLFSIYTAISDKVVGMLIRARKYQLVEFEGECLFQRRDDHVPIILLKSYPEIYKILNEKISAANAQLKESIAVYGDLETSTGNYI
ncbi:actin-binding Rho-activating protein-like isoform X1 [Sitophilus oryzae]|uniref:Actin-binding Rho-activating protein-like isoform X1 n=1 Tax=Sitophilus oryzae TaxID=7048 RepID=A0A6J2XV15_SITOR|nr:actin-binding Rho-activating protein-like isoform X1 [Sitophilus oryzae]